MDWPKYKISISIFGTDVDYKSFPLSEGNQWFAQDYASDSGAVRVTLSPKRIAIAMQRLGYEQRRVLNTRGWNVVILTGDQIKEQQRMDAHRSVEE